MRVFINYRTGDGEVAAALLNQYLSPRLGKENVFWASRSIQPGTPYDRALLKNVWRSDFLLAVIGRNWLDAGNEHGRALDDEADWVRREIVEAFEHDVDVIPVFLDEAAPPRQEQLPAPLAKLAFCQGVPLDLRRPDAGLGYLDGTLPVGDKAPAKTRKPGRAGRGGGIGSISGNNVIAVTDPRAPVNIRSRQGKSE